MALVLIVALPLAGWLVNGLAGGRLPRPLVSVIGCGTVGASFVASAVAARHLAVASDALTATLFTWIAAGDFTVSAGLLMDRLSALMALMVTGVGFLIHVYSIGYMADDSAYSRYFAYLNLFVGSMLLLVLGGNLLVLFVGWELVGLCSYLLIGFWFDRERAANAGRKAFVVNRIGDAGFLLGILLLATTTGTLQFDRLADGAGAMASWLLTATTVLLFMGASGTWAQLPLYVWLPDAMEGPTPVSALIHAATMVTAGVYMIARLHPLFLRADFTLSVVAAVGSATAFFPAPIALVEWDLKRVLAYSTISQLGYMFLAMGVLAMPAGVFHLTMHAFFKALLFLAAGSVMHATHGVVDMRRLGGLAGPLRWTALGFAIGALALAGIPPFAGFFSKDLILEHAYAAAQHGGSVALWLAGLLTAYVTAVYITRAAVLTFFAPPGSATTRTKRRRRWAGRWRFWPSCPSAADGLARTRPVRRCCVCSTGFSRSSRPRKPCRARRSPRSPSPSACSASSQACCCTGGGARSPSARWALFWRGNGTLNPSTTPRLSRRQRRSPQLPPMG